MATPKLLPGTTVNAYMGVLSVQFIFSGYQIIAKVALSDKGLDPIGFAMVRVIGTAVVLYFACAVAHPTNLKLSIWQHKTRFLLLGLSMACNIVGLIFALEYTSSAVVAILQVLRPIFAAMVSRALGMETFSYQQILGVAICIGGTAVIMSGSAVDGVETESYASTFKAFLFVCVHAMGQASYVIQQPFLLDIGYEALTINAHAFLVSIGLIGLLVPVPCHSGIWIANTTWFWSTTVYSIVLVGSYTYVVMGWAAKKVGGTAVMLFMLLQALLTVIAGRLFLAERLYSFQLLGGALVVFGISVFVSSQLQRQASETAKEDTPILGNVKKDDVNI